MRAPILPYDPGTLPTGPAPLPGTTISFRVVGLPPIKDLRQSIRNRQHRLHDRFVRLRKAAAVAMRGRAWTFDSYTIELTIRGDVNVEPAFTLSDYVSGVLDSLGGSSGQTFTYLPIVYEDDVQAHSVRVSWVDCARESYTVQIGFLRPKGGVRAVAS